MEIIGKDVVVVGLGAIGSAALWRLAARGVEVAGIERQGIGHNLGSSHGLTRLFRVACFEHPGLPPIAQKSLALWQELGAQTGQELVRQSGCLSSGTPDSAVVTGVHTAAQAAGLTVRDLDHDQLLADNPTYANTDPDDVGVFDPAAGLCFPERNVRAQTAAAERLGAAVYSDTRVLEISGQGDRVRIVTPTVIFDAAQVVVTAGPWLGKLLPGVPVQPRRTPMYWFRPKDPQSQAFDLENFPSFIRRLPDGTVLWGHGSTDEFGIKIGLDDNSTDSFATTDPDDVDRYIHPERDIAELSRHVSTAFPDVDPQPSKVITCMITDSPDELFLVGRPHQDSRLLIAGGCSGHAFKHAAGLGELLAQQVVGEQPYTPIDFLDPNRFDLGQLEF